MKFLVVAAFALAVAQASVIPNVGQIVQEILPPVATSAVVQGPSTKTQLVGPDGSQILADAPGGTIITNEHVAVPVVVAPVVAVEGVLADPVVEVAAPVVEAKALEVPVVEAKAIETPVVIVEQVVTPVIGGPVIAKAAVLAPGSGLEGHYIPDNTEKLYDDGSYKANDEQEEEQQ